MEKATPAPAYTLTAEQFNDLLSAIRGSGGDELAKSIQQMAQAQERTVRRSNAFTPGISPFSYPEGDEAKPKPRLDRETWFCATRQDESMLTPDEINAFNRITSSKMWRGDPKFGADVTAKRRFIMLPHISIDERMAMGPSLVYILQTLESGIDAVDPANLVDEILRLRAEVADVERLRAEVLELAARVPAA